MPTFEWPWAFLVLPLPYLVYRFLPAYEPRDPALRVPFLPRLRTLLGARAERGAVARSALRLAGLLLAWLLAVVAVARPVWLGARIERQTAARDLLLAVDLSQSMSQTDLADKDGPQTSRLDVVKRVMGQFIAQRHGDRLGLIVFGSSPFIQVPFTLDTHVVEQLLDETDVGMAGPRTALGDAVGLGLQMFERSEAKSRVLIVLTDGNDTGSRVAPEQAARIAAGRGVTLYTIGIGDPRAAGEEALNTTVLTRMAELTSGRFIFAADAAGLESAYRVLDGLEPVAHRLASYQPRRAVGFYALAGVALILALPSLARTLATAAALLGWERARARRRTGRIEGAAHG
jgi:Ca-activated chloride channel homolog